VISAPWCRPRALAAPSRGKGARKVRLVVRAMAGRATGGVAAHGVMVRAATFPNRRPLAAPVVRSRAVMVVQVRPVATMRQAGIVSGEAQPSPIR